MENFHGIEHVIRGVRELKFPGRFYSKQKIVSGNIKKAEFTLLASKEVDDYAEEGRHLVPAQLAGQGFVPWLDLGTFNAIIDNKLENSPNATVDALIDAIFYYLEYDDFMD